MAEPDLAYKRLFSHPLLVRELLRGFVREEWVQRLDLDSLDQVNAQFVSDDLRERTNDMVWRVRCVGEPQSVLYLTIEFQSTVDRHMPVRMLACLGLQYQQLSRNPAVHVGGRLPMILPIVLYSGRKRWTAPESFEAMLAPVDPALAPYCPRGRYLLIEPGRYTDGELERLENVAADLFRVEQSRDASQLERALAGLLERLSRVEFAELRVAFETWFRNVILPRLPDGERLAMAQELMDMRTMLVENLYEWVAEKSQEARQEGHEIGLREGREEGRREGEARLLLSQLQARFGDLPEWAQDRIWQASVQELEHWGVRLLSADRLDEVFRDPS